MVKLTTSDSSYNRGRDSLTELNALDQLGQMCGVDNVFELIKTSNGNSPSPFATISDLVCQNHVQDLEITDNHEEIDRDM